MTRQKSGAAPQGRPTREPSPQAAVLPPIIPNGVEDVKLAEARDVEQFLSQVWGEPAFIVPCHVGGHGPAYYARSEGNWVPLKYDAAGWHIEMARAGSDYHDYNDAMRAASRGMA